MRLLSTTSHQIVLCTFHNLHADPYRACHLPENPSCFIFLRFSMHLAVFIANQQQAMENTVKRNSTPSRTIRLTLFGRSPLLAVFSGVFVYGFSAGMYDGPPFFVLKVGEDTHASEQLGNSPTDHKSPNAAYAIATERLRVPRITKQAAISIRKHLPSETNDPTKQDGNHCHGSVGGHGL